MARSTSQVFRAASFAAETGEVYVILLAMSHASLPARILVSSDYPETVHGGETYQHFPFQISLPPENDQVPSTVKLSIDNVDRRIVEAVREISGGALTVEMKVVLASQPDTVEVGPWEYELRDISYDAQVVEGQLSFEDGVLGQPFPKGAFTPNSTPGVFKG